jgi:hypothetical protein
MGNLMKPGLDGRVAAKRADSPHGAQKHFLADVLGFFTIPRHAQAKPINSVSIGAEDLSPRHLVPSRQSLNEWPFGGLPDTHLDRAPDEMFPSSAQYYTDTKLLSVLRWLPVVCGKYHPSIACEFMAAG